MRVDGPVLGVGERGKRAAAEETRRWGELVAGGWCAAAALAKGV